MRPPARRAQAGPAGWRAALAGLGPFFAADAHDPAFPPAAPWRPMDELAAVPAVARERAQEVRAALAAAGGRDAQDVELRVAASVAHLGLVARLLSPYAALAVLYGWVPDRAEPADLRWQPLLGGPYPLSLPHGDAAQARYTAPAPRGTQAPGDTQVPDISPAPATAQAPAAADPALAADTAVSPDAAARAGPGDGAGTDPPAAARAFAGAVLEGPVRAFMAPFEALGVSPHILRGNAASALHGAAGMLAAARPPAASRARAFTAALRSSAYLAGTGEQPPAGPFRRRSCCLIYRAAPGRAGALCGDCALRRPAR